MAGGFWRVKTEDAAPVEPVIATAEVVALNAGPKPAKQRDQSLELKVSIHRALLDKINLNALEQLSRAQIELEVRDLVLEILDARKGLLNNAERQRLIAEVLDELLVRSNRCSRMSRSPTSS
jgi:pilus assembly protein CpaF